MGLVAGDGRATAVFERDDLEPHVRERGDRPGSAADGDRSGPVQDHEGTIPHDIYRYAPDLG